MSGDSPTPGPRPDGGSPRPAACPRPTRATHAERTARPRGAQLSHGTPEPRRDPHRPGRRGGTRVSPRSHLGVGGRCRACSRARASPVSSRRQFNIESLTVGPTTVEVTLADHHGRRGDGPRHRPDRKADGEAKAGHLGHRSARSPATRSPRSSSCSRCRRDDPAAVHAVSEMYDGRTVDAGPDDRPSSLPATTPASTTRSARSSGSASSRSRAPGRPPSRAQQHADGARRKPGTAGEPTTHDD